MKTVVCFGDSNTWGYDPDASLGAPYPVRHLPGVRWTGVLARELGPDFRVIEEGQNGRTTVFDDPVDLNRNGRAYLPACLESHTPIDLVVLMLGTNDLKALFRLPPAEIAAGAERLVRMILQSLAGGKTRPPRLLLVCPPALGDMSHLPELAERFPDGVARSERLPDFYEAVAARNGCAYLNSQAVVSPSPVDAIHLSASEHQKLGLAIAVAVRAALS